MASTPIAQSNHYVKNGFGTVLRSSGIFYFRKAPNFRTTVTFMNYWKTKRGMDVTVMASLRDMNGRLIAREELSWARGHVMNYSPDVPEETFEGSIEIEIFSLQNMMIPFAAIIVVYDTDRSVALTHNYARAYSPHEIEERRTITNGEESCWTLRDSDTVQSFAVLHNGIDAQPEQTAIFTVTRADGTKRSVETRIPELPSYGSYRFVPQDHFDGLVDFLGGEPGNGAISFTLQKAFTRMLIGNEQPAAGDLQITHSNFNYSEHKTDEVDRAGALAWMMMPDGNISGRRVRVYPDCDRGEYVMATADGSERDFRTGDLVDLESPPGPITFQKKNGGLPTRLVTAIVGDTRPGMLPFELSLGVLHEARPPKKLWWAPTCCDDSRDGVIVASRYEKLYGPYEGQPVNIRLYSEASHEVLETDIDADMVRRAETGLRLEELFPNAKEFLAGGLGWFTWYSDYAAFQVFTKMIREGGNLSMEHGF
ncbi:MAG: hypothetical protein RIM33_07495 [Alphaproteobacteria bacterium]